MDEPTWPEAYITWAPEVQHWLRGYLKQVYLSFDPQLQLGTARRDFLIDIVAQQMIEHGTSHYQFGEPNLFPSRSKFAEWAGAFGSRLLLEEFFHEPRVIAAVNSGVVTMAERAVLWLTFRDYLNDTEQAHLLNVTSATISQLRQSGLRLVRDAL